MKKKNERRSEICFVRLRGENTLDATNIIEIHEERNGLCILLIGLKVRKDHMVLYDIETFFLKILATSIFMYFLKKYIESFQTLTSRNHVFSRINVIPMIIFSVFTRMTFISVGLVTSVIVQLYNDVVGRGVL